MDGVMMMMLVQRSRPGQQRGHAESGSQRTRSSWHHRTAKKCLVLCCALSTRTRTRHASCKYYLPTQFSFFLSFSSWDYYCTYFMANTLYVITYIYRIMMCDQRHIQDSHAVAHLTYCLLHTPLSMSSSNESTLASMHSFTKLNKLQKM